MVSALIVSPGSRCLGYIRKECLYSHFPIRWLRAREGVCAVISSTQTITDLLSDLALTSAAVEVFARLVSPWAELRF